VLKGQEYIDVPALSDREYKLHFYAYKESTTTARVTLTNENSGEYLFYNLTFTAAPPGTVGTLHLECPVRQRALASVSIENPLDREVTLVATCNHGQVTVAEKVIVKPKSDIQVEVAFRPVLVVEETSTLTLTCEELGTYEYSLKLKGSRAGPEKAINFNVPLGSKETQLFRFKHFLQAQTDYACSFVNKGESGFECDSSVRAHRAGPEGLEQEVEVHFEPVRVGESFRDTLVVSSPEGGEYLCPVVGRCIPPKPQGPFTIKPSGGTVSFKNVFPHECEFTFSVDNPSFTVNRTEKIRAKGRVEVGISFKEQPGHSRTGKLIVTCAETQGVAPWLYYLRA